MSSSLGFGVVAIETDGQLNQERYLVIFDSQYVEEDINPIRRADALDMKK
jgi:hypothetical protein